MRSVNEAIAILEAGSEDYLDQWDAIQEVQEFLDSVKSSLDGMAGETLYPKTADIPTDTLATKIAEYCEELVNRRCEPLERDLAAATAIWPDVRKALRAAGMNFPFEDAPSIGSSGEVSVYLSNHGAPFSVRKKAEAIKAARKYGAGGYWSVTDYIQWLNGGGKIFEQAMANYGYSPHKGLEVKFR